ncbi:hypothetical protein QR98_0038720 [Sarcoptes scabiei]|uniref:Uncharacterized protein n=1 Tax=Sarcoptes scabiei TaxID=52283 RepID=A0A132A4T3_SARSC|nr:hypothetical protein QR98_0038720 [Sarcoptes scabiei]
MYSTGGGKSNRPYTSSSSTFKAPSRNANSFDSKSNHRSSRKNHIDDVCDETWPLDEVINRIELKSDISDNEDDQRYNVRSSQWRSGPRLMSDSFTTNRDVKRVPHGGTIYSSFSQGSKTWKDNSVKHRTYKTKKPSFIDQSDRYENNTNNNYIDDDEDHEKDDPNLSDDYSPTLRDVGIQCNFKKFPESNKKMIDPFTDRKPPVKVIKSSNNGIVSAFSDVPKLSSPDVINHRNDSYSLDDSLRTNAVYSQIDKSSKKISKTSKIYDNNDGGNISIVYKQPMNESLDSKTKNFSFNDSKYDVKTKEFSFSVGDTKLLPISLSNPNESFQTFSGRDKESRNQSASKAQDKEIIEETISISDVSSDDSFVRNQMQPMKPLNDTYSVSSRTSNKYLKDLPSKLASNSFQDSFSLSVGPTQFKQKDHRSDRTTRKHQTFDRFDNDENVLLENNSLRLKSSRSPYQNERLHKSNADLREQFIRDETRGGLAAAYKNRQQKNQNRHRTLSLNRMNGLADDRDRFVDDDHHDHYSSSFVNHRSNLHSNHSSNYSDHSHSNLPNNQYDYSTNYHQQYQPPSRYSSQTHLNSRLSDLGSASVHSRSRSIQHDRDPIVMYIPPANQKSINNVRGTDSPKLTSILRNNSTKSNATMQSTKSKKLPKQQKSQSKINLKESAKESKTGDRKSDLNRRYSIPKDTKFNWLNKFKLNKTSK